MFSIISFAKYIKVILKMLLKYKNKNDIYRMIFVENTDNNKIDSDSTPTSVATPEPVATSNVVNEVQTNSFKIQNVV